MIDLTIEGRVFLNGLLKKVAIGVDNGIIVSISSLSHAPQSSRRIEYGDRFLILPGMVDIHVHMRDLNQSYKEDWYTGTLSALKGGVTTVCDMPNNEPFIDSIRKLEEKLEIAKRKSLVDFLLYIGYPENLEELKRLPDYCPGVKLYPENLYGENISKILSYINKDKLVVVHPEDPEVLEKVSKRNRSVYEHERVRPRSAEVEAVRKIVKIVEKYPDKRVHFTHVSVLEAASIILSKKPLLNISFDVTPHHALLTEEKLFELGGIAKVNPPLRGEEDKEYIYGCLKSGIVDAYVTDHAPHTLTEKISENYEDVKPGFPGLEIALPLLLTEILEKRLSWKTLELYSSKPADLLGIAKGRILPGYDADLVVVDLKYKWTINPLNFSSKAKYSPFKGWRVRGKIKDVYVRGILALEDGEALVKAIGKPARKITGK